MMMSKTQKNDHIMMFFGKNETTIPKFSGNWDKLQEDFLPG
jgi:hypothetical protein